MLFSELLINILFTFIYFVFLSNFFIYFILLHYLFIHLRLKTVPSVFFTFFICLFVFDDYIIWSYFLVCKFCSNFSWSLCTLFFRMAHCTTILTRTFTIWCGLESFLSTIIQLTELRLWLKGWGVYWRTFSISVLSIPRYFFDKFGSILHDCYLIIFFSYKVWNTLENSFKNIIFQCEDIIWDSITYFLFYKK